MKRIHTGIALALGLAFAGSALAWNDGYYDGSSSRHDNARFDYARVLDVRPMVEQTREPVNQQVCTEVPVERYEPRYTEYHRDTRGPTVFGALVGGALGNLVGKGDGRKAATIAGAVIGGSVAHNNARRDGYGYYETGGSYERSYEERCRTQTDWRSNEDVVGYDVTYRYQGRTYHTTMDHDPGQRLRIRVDSDVTPAE